MKERDGHFENTHLRCDLMLQKGTLLDIAPDKLVMVKGWPWPPER